MLGVIVVLAALALGFWVIVLWSVVSSGDDEFPGRNDKLMWSLIVFFGFVVGAALFVVWRWEQAHAHESARRLQGAMDEALRSGEAGRASRSE